MAYKQDANNFVLRHGLEKSERISDVNYQFYSDETGSYYATNKNNSASIKHLKRAVKEYTEIKIAEERLVKKISLFKGLKNDK